MSLTANNLPQHPPTDPAAVPEPGPQARSRPEPERLARAALSRLGEPGDATLGRWLARLDALDVVRAIRGDAPAEQLGVDSARLAAFRARAVDLDPVADLERVRAVGGRFIIPGDTEWPSQLDDLGEGRPTGLWVLGTGSLRLLALRSVAVVGARACTAYGAHVAGDLAAQLAERGWVVVSGGAYGIDAAAHRGALAVGGPTVGVLACGVDVAYPRGNTALIRRIAEQGLLVSELPPGEHPTRFRCVNCTNRFRSWSDTLSTCKERCAARPPPPADRGAGQCAPDRVRHQDRVHTRVRRPGR
ncbi:DNA-processing protein DprA [Kitasatospora sp. MBT66]|uniref:DNA-processing protein DprA n=1 Tax=Kitasatospora sp. MBT66 TaxID=1444769 RepID=UPI0009EAC644